MSNPVDVTLADLAAAVSTFEAGLAGADPSGLVPSCPDWTVEDLVHHLGWVHQWAAGAVRERANTTPPPAEVAPGQLASWYRGHADDLVDALATAGPDAPAWTFAGPDERASWWLRRQVHETLVHAWDLAGATGTELDVNPLLAWDAVKEVRDMFYPRQVRLGRVEPLPAALVLSATDVESEPVVIGSGPAHEVHDDAASLMLILWQRQTYVGDEAVAALLARPLTP